MTAAPYLTPDDLRALRGDDLSGANDARLASLVASFEQIMERYRGVAYTPRDATWSGTVGCGGVLLLPTMKVRSVSSLTVNGDAVTGYTLDVETGTIYLGSGYERTVAVSWSHGFDAPPPLVLDACAEYVVSAWVASNAGNSRNVIGQTTDGVTIRYSTPSWSQGRPTGYLEVDRLMDSLDDYRVPGVA